MAILDKVKSFVKQKSVRLIITLIIIASIMTAVGFGIIALIRAMSVSDPCTKQGGSWSEDLNICVKDCGDDNTCLKKGPDGKPLNTCIKKNYCDYSGPEGKYYYDPASCECKLDCSSVGSDLEGYTKNGESTIEMKLSNDGKTYKPINDELTLTCGKQCTYNNPPGDSDLPGGTGWCPDGYYCGTHIISNSKQTNNNQGCWDNKMYFQCKGDNYCKNDSETCDASTGECRLESCKSPNVYACTQNSDCVTNADKNPDQDPTCIIKQPKSGNEDTNKFKYYNNVGYCSNSSDLLWDDNCMDPKYIGESSQGKIVNCEIHSQQEGVNAKINCPDSIDYGGCAKKGICSNNWQAKADGISCREGEGPDNQDLLCCPDDNYATSTSNTKFCCPISTKKTDGKCLLTTDYGYSLKALGLGEKDMSATKSCNTHSDCMKSIDNNYNNELWKSLGNKGDNPYNSYPEDLPTNKSDDANFASMYCDKPEEDKRGICKAVCGLFDDTDKINNKYGVMNVSNHEGLHSYSYCFNKGDTSCQMDSLPTWDESVNNIPICTSADSKSKEAWTYPNDDKGYIASGTASFTGTGEGGEGCNEYSCLNLLAKNIYKVNDFTQSDNNNCNFKAACNQLPSGYKDSKGEDIYWSDLLVKDKLKGATYNGKKIEDVWKEKISQSPIVPDPGSEYEIYYDNKSNCDGKKGAANVYGSGFETDFGNLSASPLTYISDTEACAVPRDYIPKKLVNDGTYCDSGINPTTNECVTTPKENFSNIGDSTDSTDSTDSADSANKIYAQVQSSDRGSAIITDSSDNTYYCGYLHLNSTSKSNQTLEYEGGKTQYMVCTDNYDGGTIKCYDGPTDTATTPCCSGSGADQIEYNKQNNSWSCKKSNIIHGQYVCTSSDKYGPRYRQATTDDDISILTSNPEICNLTNKTINIQATGIINEDGTLGTTTQNFPLCSLIRNHISQKTDTNNVTPGCADANNRLSTNTADSAWSHDDDNCVYKDNSTIFTGGKCVDCRLNRVDLDNNLIEGVNTSVFSGGGGSWGGEKDWMCSAHPIKFYNTYNIPYNCNWNWDIGDINPCGDSTYDWGCALRFELDDKKNPHACDNYNKSPQYNTLCKNVDCSWTKDYNCPNQQPIGKKGTASSSENFDIGYHCCCDLEGWKN